MLSGMRDEETGKPRLRVRALAIVVALLLAGPLTLFVLDLLQTVASAVY